ncbi:TetR/AcrR family transcriptional regulator [Glycomyces scopariae]|uniref:Transcriptional regulator, TetR family n=1 Tax=Glycomyces sambucus TaxID=380244 RepID=A0A1G9FJB9_9ACTN|nr:transcriptional regulator, TetR family [Glycomyces sambucus]
MGRWEPNARGRLEEAALALFTERGFEQVTVAEIAGRAGLTERTFYRHFADKREVLFPDANPLVTGFDKALEEAPDTAEPMATVSVVLDAVAAFFEGRHDYSRRRHAVVAANAELRERESIKLSTLAESLAEGLRKRGVAEPAASLAAESGVAVFKVAHAQWLAESEPRDLGVLMREALAALRDVTGAG